MHSYKLYTKSKKAWEAMFFDLQKSQKSIFWEIYILHDDEAGRPFLDLLEEKAKMGLDVRLIVDYLGSFQLSGKRIDSLKNSGVDVIYFQDKTKNLWQRIYTRTHRKILVIDENITFVGGVNISKEMGNWFDFQIRIDGSSAAKIFLKSLARIYIIAGGEKEKVLVFLKNKNKNSLKNVDFVFDKPNLRHSKTRKTYTKALREAKERVIFFTPYLFPDILFLRALRRAIKRGIDVTIFVPTKGDIKTANYVNRAIASILNRIGTNVMFTKEMMHGKGVMIDDSWVFIGSSNIDQTSFYDNYEAGVIIRDENFVEEMRRQTTSWFKDSIRFGKKHERKGFFYFLKEKFSLWLYNAWHRSKKKNIDYKEFK